MPDYRRAYVAGGTYFFAVTTYLHRPILTDPRCMAALRAAIDAVRRSHPFEILAWVVLPDHLHCVWTLPGDDHDFSRRWSLIKQRVSRGCAHWIDDTVPTTQSRSKRRESTLWQRRFWEHLVRDEQDLSRHVDYVHYNPVKHGYVTRAALWPHSTFHRYVRERVYPADWAGGAVAGESCEFGE
jgi:putative transposase